MPLVGFEPTISARKLPQIYALDRGGHWDRATICYFNPLKPELNPICYLLALLGAHHFLHVSRIRVKLLSFR